MRISSDVFAGIGLGLAVGLLVGLSTSSITATVASSLLALLATFIGLSADPNENAKLARIASFGPALVLAIIFGLSARSHGWFAPSIRTQVQEWAVAGYEPSMAKSLVAYRELGIVPNGTKVVNPPKRLDTGLFSNSLQSNCNLLEASRFAHVEDRLDAMQKAGGQWKALADSLTSLDVSRQDQIVNAAYGAA